jgi:ABC-2 type transport system ATP-binding protein
MDEPMSGLDPVGMDVMRDVMVDLSRRGATIVLSSHQMDTVEKLCDRVALINKGEKVLDGTVSEVKAAHGKNTVVVAFDGDGSFLGSLPGVAKVSDFGQYVEIKMSDGADPQKLLGEVAARLRIRRFEIVEPSLHDIFVETVTGHGKEAA